MHPKVILFDINETVLNLERLKPKFKHHFGDEKYLALWFSMLLHSSTVCLITDVKTDFKALAKATLYSLGGRLDISLSENDCNNLLDTLANLPAHDDIKPALATLRHAGFKLVAFSNSSLTLLSLQLKNATLTEYFDDVLSVESAGTFKPSAVAYQFALEKLKASCCDVRLVAAHDWDTHGALSVGLKAAFIDRLGSPYNPAYKRADINANTMNDIAELIIKANND